MHYIKTKFVSGLVVLFTIAGLAFASIPAAQAGDDNRAPDLPTPLCNSIQVQSGNNVAFHAYARGVQIYRWTGASWALVAPRADLFADANYQGQVGKHYGGPTWESNSGSKVIGMRVPGTGCAPVATAIPWLLLKAISNSGPGIFHNVTYIQRVNTVGGLAPATPGTLIDEVVEVPYTAEYYFYRAED